MSSRRVTSAASSGRQKTSILASNRHISPSKPVDERQKRPSGIVLWWRENESVFSPIISIITLVCLYGVTFSMPNMPDQSVQLVVSLSLFAMSLLFASHYFKAKEKRKVENKTPLTWTQNTPSNVRMSSTGEHFVHVWTPSKYTETVFLSYSPIVPLLGYIWVRSFEPFASWLCVVLMVVTAIMLHVLNTKLRSQAMNELLLFKTPANVGKSIMPHFEDVLGSPVLEPRLDAPEPLNRTPLRMAYEPPKRYDGPASAIYQIPEVTHQSPPARVQTPHEYTPSYTSPYSPEKPQVQQGSPMQLDNFQQFAPAFTDGEVSLHPHEAPSSPAVQMREDIPEDIFTPRRKPFGLRLGPSLDSPGLTPSAALPAQSLYNMPPTNASLPATPARFGATPAKSFPPPPRFSMQDFD